MKKRKRKKTKAKREHIGFVPNLPIKTAPDTTLLGLSLAHTELSGARINDSHGEPGWEDKR